MRRLILAFAALCASLTLAAQDKYKTVKDIQYVSDSDTSAYRRERCKLDIYMPEGRKGFKTIVWFHGGGLTGGKREIPNELREQGIILIGVEYRLCAKDKDKKDAIVEMTLPEDNNQIFASKYETVLPSKEELQKLLEDKNFE